MTLKGSSRSGKGWNSLPRLLRLQRFNSANFWYASLSFPSPPFYPFSRPPLFQANGLAIQEPNHGGVWSRGGCVGGWVVEGRACTF